MSKSEPTEFQRRVLEQMLSLNSSGIHAVAAGMGIPKQAQSVSGAMTLLQYKGLLNPRGSRMAGETKEWLQKVWAQAQEEQQTEKPDLDTLREERDRLLATDRGRSREIERLREQVAAAGEVMNKVLDVCDVPTSESWSGPRVVEAVGQLRKQNSLLLKDLRKLRENSERDRQAIAVWSARALALQQSKLDAWPDVSGMGRASRESNLALQRGEEEP